MGSVGAARTDTATVADDEFIDRIEYDRDREYHKFKDNPSGGWSYEGDGSEATEWFREHSNYDDVIKSLTSEEIDAWNDRWVP